MNFKTKIAALAVALLPAANIATAQEAGEKSINLGLSVFGGTLSGSYRINSKFGARGLVMGGLGYKKNLTRDGVDYALDGKLAATGLLADFYPNEGNWRVSGGVIRSGSSFAATGTLSATNPYKAFTSGSIDASLKFNRTYIPTITTGYDWKFGDKWQLSGEAGAMFINGASLSVTSTDAAIQAELDADATITGYKNDATKLKVFPYLGLSVGMRF